MCRLVLLCRKWLYKVPMQNLTVSDLNSSSVASRTSIISKKGSNETRASNAGSRQGLRKSANVPLYNSKSCIRRTHPGDPAENSILADLSYIPEPVGARAGPVAASRSSIFSSAAAEPIRFDTAAERSRTDEELQELVQKLQTEVQDLKRAHADCDQELEDLAHQMQQIREVMVKSNENMARALDSSCFVVMPCRHYVVVDKNIVTLTNSKCPKCRIHVTESYLVKHK